MYRTKEGEAVMKYDEALTYIHGLYWKGKKSGLEKTKELLELCGHPERGLNCIHIAGTNGKGSTAAMLESVCRCAGLKTGLYTSPYIVRYNERIQVSGQEIPDEQLSLLTEYLAGMVEQMEIPPSEFEFGTVLAFLYFKEQQCDIVILETGLGGTFDSTNVIENPLLCIITALGLDHTAQLGSTMTQIANAKAGIIKQGVPVVFYGENKEGEAVIRKRCEELSSSLVMPDFAGLKSEGLGGLTDCQQFSYKREPGTDALEAAAEGHNIEYSHLRLSLPGLYQQKNAALVLEAVEQLKKKGLPLTVDAVQKGLCSVHWQARLEVLLNKPLVLADGSHNPLGMQATVESLRQYFQDKRLQFVFGAMADKELNAMIKLFLPLAGKVYVTAPAMPRAMDAEALLSLCQRNCTGKTVPEFVLCRKVQDAVSLIRKEGEQEVVVVIGSLYLAGEVKRLMKG